MRTIPYQFRRLILVIVGLAAFAGGPAVALADAQANNGSGSTYDCAAGQTWNNQRYNDYTSNPNKNSPAAQDAKKDTNYEYNQAKQNGCDMSGFKNIPLTVTATSTSLVGTLSSVGSAMPGGSGSSVTTAVIGAPPAGSVAP
jgi:hypothetical protein